MRNSNTDNIDFDNIADDNKGFISDETLENYNQPSYMGTGNIILNNHFNTDFIGSNEGTLAFGYGAYTAENRSVAERYRSYGEKGARPKTVQVITKEGNIFTSPLHNSDYLNWTNNPEGFTATVLDDIKDTIRRSPQISLDTLLDTLDKKYRKSISDLQAQIEFLAQNNSTQNKNNNNPFFNTASRIKNLERTIRDYHSFIDALNSIADFHILEKQNGNLYEFDTPEYEVILDWDATLAEQPEHIRTAIDKILDALEKSDMSSLPSFKMLKIADTGGDFYKALTELFAERNNDKNYSWRKDVLNKKLTSMLFNKFGVPGLCYFDRLSRDEQQGTHNFVTWNEDFFNVVAISPSSNPDAIDYFNEHNTGENYNQDMFRGTRFNLNGDLHNIQGKGNGGIAFGAGVYLSNYKPVAEYFRKAGYHPFERVIFTDNNGNNFNFKQHDDG